VIRVEHMEGRPRLGCRDRELNQSRVGFTESTNQLELYFYDRALQSRRIRDCQWILHSASRSED